MQLRFRSVFVGGFAYREHEDPTPHSGGDPLPSAANAGSVLVRRSSGRSVPVTRCRTGNDRAVSPRCLSLVCEPRDQLYLVPRADAVRPVSPQGVRFRWETSRPLGCRTRCHARLTTPTPDRQRPLAPDGFELPRATRWRPRRQSAPPEIICIRYATAP